MNMFTLVGRLVDIQDNAFVMNVPRSYKNEEGIYENDQFVIEVSKNIHSNMIEYCKVGDMVGVKGMLESKDFRVYLKADKITFLSSKGGE